MKHSQNSYAKHHEIQHLLIALDKLGEDFGHNRDTYYSLKFISILEQYFINYGLWENFQHFIFCKGFTSLLSYSYWKLY